MLDKRQASVQQRTQELEALARARALQSQAFQQPDDFKGLGDTTTPRDPLTSTSHSVLVDELPHGNPKLLRALLEKNVDPNDLGYATGAELEAINEYLWQRDHGSDFLDPRVYQEMLRRGYFTYPLYTEPNR